MNKLFTTIRERDFNKVREMLDSKPELVNCIAGKSLKKDAGLSPLQTAIKTENFDIAELLIQKGANVWFMESAETFEWSKPVLHFAISATVLNSRFGIYIPKYSQKNKTGFFGFFKKEDWKPVNEPTEKYKQSFLILEMLVKGGAKTECKDSYGVSSAERFCSHLQHDVILDSSKKLRPESLEDLIPILHVLGIREKSDFLIPSAAGNKSTTVYEFYKHFIDQLLQSPAHNKELS